MSLGLHIAVTNDTEAAAIRDALDRILGPAPWTEVGLPDHEASPTRRWAKQWRRPGSDGLVLGLFAAHVEQAWAARVEKEIDAIAPGAGKRMRVYRREGNLMAILLELSRAAASSGGPSRSV
jgi:hypothetical protein